MDQVVVHDRRYPNVVYDVVAIPGEIKQTLSRRQADFIDDLTDHWADKLKALERKVHSGKDLTDDEKAWALELTTNGATDAIREADDYVRTQRGLRERFLRGLEISYRYDGKIRDIFRGYGLPEDLAILPHVESSFQYAARSSAGAVGAWQFTRGTGRLYMPITPAFDARLDPLAAADAAARYLRDAYKRLNSWPLALTGYNHGVAGMASAQEKYGDYEQVFLNYDGRRFGFASKNFYAEFLAARNLVAEADARFAAELIPEPPHDLDATVLEGRTTPGRLAGAFGVALADLVGINPAWSRRAVREGLALPKGVTVWLPRGTHAKLAESGVTPDYTLAGWIDEGGSYVVQPGDSLSVIAETYGVSVRLLRELNGMSGRQSLIRVGQRLNLGDTDSSGVHVVRRGESLSTIARKYRMPISALRRLNGMAPNESLIVAGQRLRVSGEFTRATEQVHVVRRGDTLDRIARTYRVRLTALLVHNGLSKESVIRPGQKIRIPS
ncbi:MAG: LysM peptidoglycan-binding domain-containing protein [Acidobacteria bacterium]|nr:LysM peptidoglycan-binding domain-containing protein [Acidobacteriota bacterium]NIM63467.1 LysM peptidoglycan-binding domain-containing protein [Acidobacteriota bacterium]NIO60895.1 LysM peptidoglycan-binding domain-containing protein [Acidobacteriota bacterium]NIQ31087.1 LysM peptidoglycan-binding domain-containing protein [Acidobacteriota bacterium]NIQ87356.1 LysM peptidoglycan-binding domain-containing protein [Acidobacteriota bacterium]